MSHRGGFAAVFLALALGGCGGDDTADPPPNDAPALTTTCPNGEDRRAVINDFDANAEGEPTPSAAVDVFLQWEGDDANLDDFELIKENEEKATYAYSDGNFELVRLYVRKLGWFVDSYEFCQGAI